MELGALYKIVEVSSAIFILFPAIICLFIQRRLDKKYFPLALLIYTGVLAELINLFLMSNQIRNYFVLRIYTYFEVILLCLFYYLFFKNKFKSIFFLLPIILFIFSGVIDYKINGIDNFDNYATAFEAIVFSFIALWSFYYILKKMIFDVIINEPFLWFNTAILLYFGGNLILFVFNNYLLQYTSSHLALWTIHALLNIIYNIALAIGFWKTRRP